MSDQPNRRDFLKTTLAATAAGVASIAGCGGDPKEAKPNEAAPASGQTAAADDTTASLDVREAALRLEKQPELVDGYKFKFASQALPEAGTVEVKLLPQQAYQVAQLNTVGEDKKTKFQGLAIPQQDGTIKLLAARPGQKVKLAVYADKEAQDPIATHLLGTQGQDVNWVKGLTDQVKDIPGAADGLKLAVPYFNGKKDKYPGMVSQFEVARKALSGMENANLWPDNAYDAPLKALTTQRTPD